MDYNLIPPWYSTCTIIDAMFFLFLYLFTFIIEKIQLMSAIQFCVDISTLPTKHYIHLEFFLKSIRPNTKATMI